MLDAYQSSDNILVWRIQGGGGGQGHGLPQMLNMQGNTMFWSSTNWPKIVNFQSFSKQNLPDFFEFLGPRNSIFCSEKLFLH